MLLPIAIISGILFILSIFNDKTGVIKGFLILFVISVWELNLLLAIIGIVLYVLFLIFD